MSARDSESGSSSYKGGSGRAGGLGNGGIGGGMGGGGNYGGGMGGGAGRMGGIGSRTGLTTGNQMFGGIAFGRPGGNAMNPGAWGVVQRSPISQGSLNRPTRPGLLGNPIPASVPGVNPVPENVMAVEDVPMPPASVPNIFNQDYLGGIANFRNMINGRYGWNDQPVTQGPGPMLSQPRFLSDPRDAANRGPYTGQRIDFGSVGGGQGMQSYSSGRDPYNSANSGGLRMSPGGGRPSGW